MLYADAMDVFDHLPRTSQQTIRSRVWREIGTRDVEPTLQGVREAFARAVTDHMKEIGQ